MSRSVVVWSLVIVWLVVWLIVVPLLVIGYFTWFNQGGATDAIALATAAGTGAIPNTNESPKTEEISDDDLDW